jgi:hypothetical protein
MSYFASFSPRAKRAIFLANWQAKKEGAGAIAPEHILSALLKEDPELFAIVMPQHPNAARELLGLLAADGRTQLTENQNGKSLSLSAGAKEVVLTSSEVLERFGHKSVGTQHLLLALLLTPRQQSNWFRRADLQDDSTAKQILLKYGFSPASVETKIKEGIVTPLTWVLDDSIIKLNAQLAAMAELLISKGAFKRSEFVAILDQNAGPIVPENFLAPLIDALFEKGRLTASEKEKMKSARPSPGTQEQHAGGTSEPISER